MQEDSAFSKYVLVKKQFDSFYEGISIAKIISLDLVSLLFVPIKFSFRSIILIFKTYDLGILKKVNSVDVLFTIGNFNRSDYYEIIHYVMNANTGAKFFLDFSTLKTIYFFRLKNILYSLYIVFRVQGISLNDKMILFTKLVFYLNILSSLKKNRPNPRKFCTFSSAHSVESLFSEYFKSQGVVTYSLQHGVYFVFKKQKLLDAVLYENITVDFQMVWGNYTKQELIDFGIDPNAVKVAGYPRDIIRPNFPSKIDKNRCLLLLARYTFQETNLALIELVKKLCVNHELNVCLKLHPTLDREFYEKLALSEGWSIAPRDESLTNCLQTHKYGWAIAINTAAYYESFLYYIPCLRYSDGSFENSADVTDDIFSDFDELKSKLDLIPSEEEHSLHKYFKVVDSKLKEIIGYGINNYGEISR